MALYLLQEFLDKRVFLNPLRGLQEGPKFNRFPK